jgi:5'-deoxynucleotidase YfbR-like HD superfamily hydrolase/dUTPase
MNNDCKTFIENFDIVQNAMDMRTLQRWNGRDLRTKENLSEHTHLVTACAIELYDEFKDIVKESLNFEEIIRYSMLHDSLELLRGDILSVTKDIIPNLRNYIEEEETLFEAKIIGPASELTKQVVLLADLKACYKFIEYELRFPSNDFAIQVYKSCKQKYDKARKEFINNHTNYLIPAEIVPEHKFVKGYAEDAGCDVILKHDAVFMPMSTTKFDLEVQVIPTDNEMSFLCSRTSAAAKGLIVAMCPIDPNFCGTVTAIVHNLSNSIIEYKTGEAFCQVVTTPIHHILPAFVKKEGKRSDGKLGSTGK